MSRLIIFGATGSLGSHVLRLAIAAGHQVTAFVRSPSRLPFETQSLVSVHQGDLNRLAPADIAQLISGHDALINCAGHVADGQDFVDLVDRLVTAVESMPAAGRPVCWFLAGAAVLDIDSSGRKGVELPGVEATYWPHLVNFERLSRSELDWRLLCPGPLVEEPALGLDRLRIAQDTLPVLVPESASALPRPLVVPIFASLIPQMILPYADAAAFMLANLSRGDTLTRHRVGLALLPGMQGRKSRVAGSHLPAEQR